jgi:hypothetical protein
MRQRALHLVATCAAPNASCGVKPQAARGSGAEPVAAAAVIYVRANPGRDIMLKGAGPSGNILALAVERRARRVGSSDKAGTIAF